MGAQPCFFCFCLYALEWNGLVWVAVYSYILDLVMNNWSNKGKLLVSLARLLYFCFVGGGGEAR